MRRQVSASPKSKSARAKMRERESGQWLWLWSLPTPGVRGSGSNPVISNILFIIKCIEMTKIKKKEAVNGPFLRERELLTVCVWVRDTESETDIESTVYGCVPSGKE